MMRDTDYFAAKIGEIDSAEQLVSDRRLLSVALGAFGLHADIDNKYFIRKVLEDGVLKEDALANRLTDERYKSLTKAFGFGDFSVPAPNFRHSLVISLTSTSSRNSSLPWVSRTTPCGLP